MWQFNQNYLKYIFFNNLIFYTKASVILKYYIEAVRKYI